MTEEVKAEFRIGKTQWRKWGNEAKRAFNQSMRLGFTLGTAIEEANAVQLRVREGTYNEVSETTPETPNAQGGGEEAPVAEASAGEAEAAAVPQAEVTQEAKPKKPRAPRAKKPKVVKEA